MKKWGGGSFEPTVDCGDGVFPNPNWSRGLNKIYVSCPEINVGINTIAPRANLDVQGNAYMARLAIGNVDPSSMDKFVHVKSYSNSPSTKIMLIENPERKLLQLDNSGLLRVREVKLDALTWPDYVFEPDYKLNSLPEIEAFIKKHKHLPNVPDAKTIETEGLNLAEMDKILMQKIEELTLYLIQQNKTLEEQAKKIKELEILLQK